MLLLVFNKWLVRWKIVSHSMSYIKLIDLKSSWGTSKICKNLLFGKHLSSDKNLVHLFSVSSCKYTSMLIILLINYIQKYIIKHIIIHLLILNLSFIKHLIRRFINLHSIKVLPLKHTIVLFSSNVSL